MFQSSSKFPPSQHPFTPSWAHTSRALPPTLNNTNKIKTLGGLHSEKLEGSEDKFWESVDHSECVLLSLHLRATL